MCWRRRAIEQLRRQSALRDSCGGFAGVRFEGSCQFFIYFAR
jgi:hypothetical protein